MQLFEILSVTHDAIDIVIAMLVLALTFLNFIRKDKK